MVDRNAIYRSPHEALGIPDTVSVPYCELAGCHWPHIVVQLLQLIYLSTQMGHHGMDLIG